VRHGKLVALFGGGGGFDDLTVRVEPMAAPRCFGQHIVTPLHTTGIGAGNGAEKKPFHVTDIAEAAHQIGWHRSGVEGLYNDEIGVFVIAPENFPFSG
jgi:hypothetical protein